MVASNRRLCAVIAFVFAVAVPTLASAATADFRVLFDVDNNAATGCTDGGIAGIEQILVTRIVTTDTSAQVTRMYRQGCSAGVFGAPADLDLTARPAGFSSPSGLVFAEARIAYSALTNGQTLPLGMRLYFDASDGFSAQSVEEMPNGDSILYPPTDIPKRHSVSTRGTPRTIILDGQVGDWNGINPLVVGVAASGSTAVRILKIYAYANPVDHFLYFRFDGFLNNSNPYAQDDNYSRKIGEGLNVAAPGVLANDGDPSGKPLTAMPVSPAEHGNVTLNPDGSFTYAPDDPTSFTSDKFDYKANNGTKDSNVARVTINVSINPSQAPTAVDDNYQTSEDTTLDVSAPGVLGNDIDPDGPTLTSTLLTDASHGKVTLASNGAFTYIPAANYSGTDTFTYRVSDGTNSDDAIVTITIGAINDAPKTSNLTVTTPEDTPVGITLSATDTEGGPLTYNVGSPTNGSLSGTPPNLTYSPFPNYFGPDSFTYTVTDSGGKTSSPASVVNITVTPVNDPPSFTSGGNVSSNEDTPFSASWGTNVSAGPGNEAGQTLQFNITGNSNPGLFASGPSIAVNGTTGTLSYTPALNASGSANITVTLSDNGGGANTSAPVVFTITINPVNDPPTVNAAANLAYTEGNGAVVIDNTVTVTDPDSNITTATVQITANYVNGEDILAFVNNFGITGAFNPLNGTLTLTGPASPANFQSALRTVTYQNTSAAPSTAPRTLTWTVNDPQPSSGTDTSTITITAINTAPTLTVTGAVTHTEGGAATNLATAANIVDPDDTNIESATIQISNNFAAGQDVLSFVNTVNISGSFVGNTLTLTGSDTKANYIAALQAVQYTNTSDTPSTLQRTITWVVNDGNDPSNTQNTTLDVTATNDAPVNTLPAPQSTNEDTPLTLTGATKISISDVDADPDDVQVTLNVTNGTVTVNPIGVGALTNLTGNGTNTVVATGTVAEINAVLDGLVFNPTTDYFGAASIQVVTDDLGNNPSGNQTDTDTLNITVNAVNDAPVLTVTGAVTHTEGGAATNLATAANITDVDDTNIESATIRISANFVGGEDVLSFVNFGNISGSFVGDTLTLSGSDTKANYITALQSVQYTNTSDTPSTLQRTITWKVNDGDVDSNTQTTTLDVTATNDAPVNNVPGAQATPEDTPLTFGVVNSNLISISDPDANPDDVQVTLNVTNGTVALDPSDTGALTTLTGNGTATVVATGTIAEINAALDGLVFSPATNYFGAASIQIVTDDLGNNPSGNQTDTDTINITVNTVNDAPVNTVPGTQTFNEDTTLTFSTGNGNAVSVADVDLGAGNIQVALSTTAGTLTLSGTTGLSFSFSDADGTGTGDGTADASMTFRGTLTDVNNALQGMTFTPTLNIDGAQTISMTSNDLGNSGSGGSLTDSDTINLSITAVNDAPVNSVPGAQNTNEDTPLTFSSGNGNLISISDPDAGANIVQVQLSVTNGTLTLSGTTGLSFSFSDGNGTGAGDGTADATMTFRGTIADINTALNGLVYSPNLDSSAPDTLSITTNDLGNTGVGGALTDSDTVTITITAQNDAPVNTVPGTQTFNEDSTLTFSTGNGNAISVADADVGGGNITVTLSTTAGTLAFGSTTGLSGVTNNAATITGTGTLVDINNALQGLTFTPTLNIDGPQTISFTSNDNGNTGAGGPQSDNDTINLSITAVNDAPVITRPVSIVVNEDTPFTFNGGNVISIADVDAGAGNVQVSLSVTNGMLSLNNLAGLSFSFSDANGTGTGDGASDASMTFRGSLTDVNNALNGMVYVGNSNFSGSDTLNIGANDLGNTGTGGALTDSESTSITVNAINDPPVNTVPGLQTFNEDTTLTFSNGNGNAISVSDADVAAGNLTVTLTTTAGTLSFGSVVGLSAVTNNAASITGTGTLANINNALQGLVFSPTLNLNGPQTISLTTSDNGNTGAGGTQSDNDTINLSITAVNDAPVNTVPGGQTMNQDTTFTFTGATQISVADVDLSGGNIQITLTGTNGTITLSGTTGLSFSFSDANGTGTGDGTADATMTFRGTLTDVNNALNGLQFTSTPGFFSGPNANVAIVSNDLGNTGTGGALTDSDSVNIFVQQVNQAPVNSVPGAQTVNEDATLTFSAGNSNLISISDPDAGGATVQVTLSVTAGTLTLNGVAGLSFVFSDGNGTGAGDGTADATMTFRGTIANINTALNGMTFSEGLNVNGSSTLTITTNDLGNSGPGGPQTDTDNVTINITAVNDAPVNTVPGAQTMNQDTTFTFTGATQISVADVDLGGGNIQITLTGTNGTITLSGTTGLSFSFSDANGTGAGDGTADATMTFRGTLTDVNNALNGLQFTSTPGFFSGPNASVAIVSNDLGNTGTGGALTDSDTVNIFVQQVNQAPVNSVPGTQTVNEDATLTFSSGNSNLISISDPDAGAATVQVSLSVTVGTLTLSGTSGLSFVFSDGNGTGAGDGTADATMVFRGTIANINTALAGMTFSGGTDVNGSSTLQIITNDLGNTGPGGPQTDTDTVTINITAVNDAPVITRPATVTATEDIAFTFNAGNTISVADLDAGAGNVQVSLSVSNGTVTLSGTTGLSFSFSDANGTGTGDGTADASMTFRGTLTNVNAALNGMTYTGTLNFNGSDTLNIGANDLGNTGTGGALTDSKSTSITVNAANDAPVNTVPGLQTFNEDTTLTFSTGNGNAISVADVDVGGGNITVTLTTTAGTMAFGSVAGLSGVTNNAASITGTGTLANINNALQGLVFSPTLNINGPQTISFTSSDNGNTGTGGTLTDNDTINLSITAVNDAPVLTTPASVNATEDVAFTFNGGNTISVADVDLGAGNIQISLTATNGTMSLSGTAGLSFAFSDANGTGAGDGTNDATMTFRGTLANVNAALNNMTFLGASNFNGTASMSVSANDLGNTGSGGALTAGPNAITINVAAVNDKPVALAKVFNAQAHMKIVGLSGLLTGVTDPDNGTGPGPCVSTTFTVNTITPVTGGTVSNINTSAGTFDFSPAAGFTGGASLTYTVDDTGCPGVATSDPATITINVAGPPIYFVKSVAVGTGDCTLGNECTLATAIPLATGAAGRHIFISDANTHTPGVAITLNTGGHLMGQGVTPPVDGDGVLTNDFDDLFDISPPAGTIARPAINAARPTVMNSAITLNANSQLRGLNLNIQSGTAVAATGRTGLKITDMNIQSNTNVAGTFALDLNTSSGDFTIGTVSINAGRNGSAVRFATTTSTNTVTIGNITTEGGQGFSGSNTGATNFSFTNVTSTTGAAVTTSTSSGNFTFNNITSTTGAALSVTSSGAGDFTASNVTSTTGTAVGVTTATGDFTFTQINANGAVKGISVNSLTGAGTFTVNGTSTTDGTGGTVQNCTQRGAEFISSNNVTLKNMNFTNNGTAGTGADDANCSLNTGLNTNCHAGVHLQTVTTALLDNLNVDDGNQIGINGQTVSGLTVQNCNIRRNGDESGEAGLQMEAMTGTNSFSSNVFTDNAGHQMELLNYNTAGSPTITVNNNQFSFTNFPGGAAIGTTPPAGITSQALFAQQFTTGTMTIHVTNNQFTRIWSSGLQFDINNGGNMLANIGIQANRVTAAANTFTNCGLGPTISGASTGTMDFYISNNAHTNNTAVTGSLATNQITASRSAGSSGNWDGVIHSNTIGNSTALPADVGSGCATGGCTGIELNNLGASGNYHMEVRGNTINHVNGSGIGVFHNSGSSVAGGETSVVITGNLIQNPDAASGNGIRVVNGDGIDDDGLMCMELGGNTAIGGVPSTLGDRKNEVNGHWGNGTNDSSIRFQRRTVANGAELNAGGAFKVRNYVPDGTPIDAEAVAFVVTQNTFGAGTVTNVSSTGNTASSPQFTGGAAACP